MGIALLFLLPFALLGGLILLAWVYSVICVGLDGWEDNE